MIASSSPTKEVIDRLSIDLQHFQGVVKMNAFILFGLSLLTSRYLMKILNFIAFDNACRVAHSIKMSTLCKSQFS